MARFTWFKKRKEPAEAAVKKSGKSGKTVIVYENKAGSITAAVLWNDEPINIVPDLELLDNTSIFMESIEKYFDGAPAYNAYKFAGLNIQSVYNDLQCDCVLDTFENGVHNFNTDKMSKRALKLFGIHS